MKVTVTEDVTVVNVNSEEVYFKVLVKEGDDVLAEKFALEAKASAEAAEDSAISASLSEQNAFDSEQTATAQAGIATTKAQEASVSASNALASEQSAEADAIATAADRVQTGLDVIATTADRVQTGLDVIATAADRVQTGLDAIATASDRVQTGLDAQATAADRIQTGLDASTATTQAGIATVQAGDALISANNAAASASTAASAALNTPLTGFTTGANTTILSTDTTLEAFGKTQGQINARVSSNIYSANGTLAGNRAVTLGGFSLDLIGTTTSRFFANGNVGINSTTDAGFRLDVNGTARVQGALTVTGSTTASGAIGRGLNLTSTLVAAANNDVLVGLDILPTFNVGAFTGVTRISLRVDCTGGTILSTRAEGLQISSPIVGHTSALFLTPVGANGRVYRIASYRDNSLGYFTIRDEGAGVDVFNIDSARRVGILTTSPTDQLDVNGRVRVRTTDNAVGNFITKSATGVLQERTALQSITDMSSDISGWNASVRQRLEHTTAGVLEWVNV
jgi:hypothetical protein